VVGNARKYAKTIVEIEVRQNGGNVEILVRNDIREGGGLSPSQGINAFEGVRNENATAASTGVGLPASRGSMQKMGGDIYLLDGGKESGITVFALSIPQADLVLEAVDAGRKTKTEEEKKRTGRASARRAKKSGQKKDAPVQAPVQEQVKETRVLLLPDTNYFIKLFSQGMEVSQILKNLPPGSDFIVTRPVYDELVAMSSQNWRKGADGKPLVPGRAMAELQEAAYDGRITIFEVKVGEQDLQALSGRLKTLSDNNNSRLSAADASIVLAARELGDIYPNISPLSIDADVQILMMDWKKSRAQKQAP